MAHQGRFDGFSEIVKQLAARRVSPAMASPCQEAQHRGLCLVLDHPGGSEPIKSTLVDH
jgi:hypothetical protein